QLTIVLGIGMAREQLDEAGFEERVGAPGVRCESLEPFGSRATPVGPQGSQRQWDVGAAIPKPRHPNAHREAREKVVLQTPERPVRQRDHAKVGSTRSALAQALVLPP